MLETDGGGGVAEGAAQQQTAPRNNKHDIDTRLKKKSKTVFSPLQKTKISVHPKSSKSKVIQGFKQVAWIFSLALKLSARCSRWHASPKGFALLCPVGSTSVLSPLMSAHRAHTVSLCLGI